MGGSRKYRVISLFSGAGGLDLGFIQAGLDVVWANDVNADAVRTYRRNIGHRIIARDIADVEISTLPEAEVIAGGFPCQGFSLANRNRDINDSRNQLYTFFLDAVRAKKPLCFIAENVKGILSLESGTAFSRILSDFNSAGYKTEFRLVNMADYGIPQRRERVIIIGIRNDAARGSSFQFPEPTHARMATGSLKKWVSIKEAIDGLPAPTGQENLDPNHVCSQYKVVYRNFTAHRPTDPEKPSPTILARGNGGGGVVAIPHYNGARRLSVRESAIVQGFPTDYMFEGSLSSCYRQVGNAVSPPFGRILGKSIIAFIEEVANARGISI